MTIMGFKPIIKHETNVIMKLNFFRSQGLKEKKSYVYSLRVGGILQS